MSAKVSIVVVNLNGRKRVRKCLDSLKNQTYKNIEIIVVDNGSSDGSQDMIKEIYPSVKLIELEKNLGFAEGNNRAFKIAKGQFLLLLNNDTWSPKDLVESLLLGFKAIPRAGILQPKLLVMEDPKRLDMCGSYWTNTGLLYHFGRHKLAKLKKYSEPIKFFSLKGAAMMIKREVLDEIGLFDPDFWCYYEETDLCHRAWIAGYESWYYPSAYVLHEGGKTAKSFKQDHIQFHNFKNKLLSISKNIESRGLVRWIPEYLLMYAFLAAYWLVIGRPRHSWAVIKAVIWNAKNVRSTLEKRGKVQATRLLPDKGIFALTEKNPSMKYYKHLLQGSMGEYPDELG